MTQSSLDCLRAPLHVALILDGNGRWAERAGRPRLAGHRVGAKRVREVVEAAPELGIHTLSLYAFSSDNWKRPKAEVRGLFRLLRGYLAGETLRLQEARVRLSVIGRRDRLPEELVRAIQSAEQATAKGGRLHLRLAIDYSAREALVATAARLRGGTEPLDRDHFRAALDEAIHSAPSPEVDLLIRTGGEQRLSDFLLWEAAYAELLFDPTPWPEYTSAHLAAAVGEFARRERRFGALPLPLHAGV